MDIEEFLIKINDHTKAIYKNEIEQVNENGKIINWLLGLAGIALLFSFNKYDAIDSEKLWIILVQAVIFISIIIVGFLHRLKTKSFKDHTVTIIRMFDFLKIEFELIPDEIVSSIETEQLITVFDNYLNGEFFEDESKETFERISNKQAESYSATRILTSISIVLMVLQFGCFFIMILI